MAWGAQNESGAHPLLRSTPNISTVLGYTQEDFIDVEYDRHIHPDDLDRVNQKIEENLKKGITSFSDQYRLYKKNGDLCWVNDHSQLVVSEDGELLGITGYISDITDLITAQKTAEQLTIERVATEKSARGKVQFLANMSHEIRTPMNGVIGMADALMHTELAESQRDIVNIIMRSGNALVTIINDILDFSKIDSDKIEFERESFDFIEVIQEVATLSRAGLIKTDVDMLTRVEPGLRTMVMGDAGRVRQIFMNLVGNATKFTVSGHVLVDVKGQKVGDNLELNIDVTDTGIGIPPEKIEVIFEKFSQADNSTTREYGGTGLGLAISRNLTQLMGGQLSVKSKVGEGSTFTVSLTLPLSELKRDEAVRTACTKPQNVLVLDDNQLNLDILKEQLKHMGHEFVGLNTPQKAINALKLAKQKNITVDTILLDFHMPKIDGEMFFKLLKAHDLTLGARVIFLTSNCEEKLRVRLKDMGAQAVLTKPVSAAQLGKALSMRYSGTAPLSSKTQEIKVSAEAPRTDLILIAEDNAVNQMFFETAMGVLGHKFKIVGDGQEAVEAWQALKPDLILMDISMPKLNGKEATVKIREFEKQNNLTQTPIIAVTAHAFKQDEEECLEAGMNDYLTKPITLKALQEKIDKFSFQGESAPQKLSA